MINKINSWLENPKRKYAEGIEYFNRFASVKQKQDFGAFFTVEDGEEIEQFDMRFTTLVNQISFIQLRIKSNPDLFKEAISEALDSSDEDAEKSKIVPMNIDQLPDEFSAERERLKEIVPLMAKIHADMADEKKPDAERAELRKELIQLDGERRAIWDKINSADLKVKKSSEETEVEKNMVAVGAEISDRIKLLKDYIYKNNKSLEEHVANGKEKLAENSRQKIAEYTAELEDLQKLINE